LEKLDGSMITPYVCRDGGVQWHTKMGATGVAEPVNEFVRQKRGINEYEMLALDSKVKKITPMFEWCSRKQRIVLDYPVDRLVLTAVRDTVTGEYYTYDQLVEVGQEYKIEVVRAKKGTVGNLQSFMQEVNDLKGEEGYVIRWDDGMMVKVKAAEYVMLHKCLDGLRFEKSVIEAILREKIDDAIPLLPKEIADSLLKFQSTMYHNIHAIADKLWWEVRAAMDNTNGSKKDFAVNYVNAGKIDPNLKSVAFTTWENIDEGVEFTVKTMMDDLLKATGSQTRVDQSRYLMGGIKWEDFLTVAVPDVGE